MKTALNLPRYAQLCLVFFCSIFLMTACGGGGSQVSENNSEVNVDGNQIRSQVNKTGSYYLNVNGDNNNVEVAQKNNLQRLHIRGSGNEISLGAETLVDAIHVDGNNNRIYVPHKFLHTRFSQTGTNNLILER